MKTKQRDVVRWLIWFQMAVLVLLSIGSLADRERIPEKFFPPKLLMFFCEVAMLTTPLFVIAVLLAQESGERWGLKLLVSFLIAAASIWASLPMVR